MFTRLLLPIAGAVLLSHAALANGVDSRAYTCGGLQALIAHQGFVFISQATFGDFVVAHRGYCVDGDILEIRTVPTSDTAECPVNYCVSRGQATISGGGM